MDLKSGNFEEGMIEFDNGLETAMYLDIKGVDRRKSGG